MNHSSNEPFFGGNILVETVKTASFSLFVAESGPGNLSKGMRQLNGVYTQRFNQTHGRVGHVFQGRYKGILVQKDAYLLELARYIVLNPVRAGMVRSAKDWRWSSYWAMVGQIQAPEWLHADGILATFSANKSEAIERYQNFVTQGKKQPKPWEQLKNQIYLGSDEFVDEMQCQLSLDAKLSEIPSAQKRPVAKPLGYYREKYPERDVAITIAYQSGGYSMEVIGDFFGLHYSRVSRIIKNREKAKNKT